jgi:MFS family permease
MRAQEVVNDNDRRRAYLPAGRSRRSLRMTANRSHFLFLNVGHFADHLFMLIFAKAAFSAGLAFGLADNGAYAALLPYGIPAMVLFAACAPLAAHLADKWRRNTMMAVFFIGIGLASAATSLAQSPLQVGIGLAVIGVFAAIYHPVGISMVIQGGGNVGWRLGVNGVWGNMGVAGAPLLTGLILSFIDWRAAFYVPGAMSVALGLAYVGMIRSGQPKPRGCPRECPRDYPGKSTGRFRSSRFPARRRTMRHRA